ncbi:hypothetical protein BASA83_009523 [Batrachochytrium salamandrivorans]|nr:hypothetical protein BASA62_002376 [Batrachochytrium salamandrivorans]KAH9268131.1 hypothetical protein BASA83_009523 [Batrachochytrium salamandrivorans]
MHRPTASAVDATSTRQRYPRTQPAPRSQQNSLAGDDNVRISKALSYILRHGAKKEGLEMQDDGFVALDSILSRKQFSGQTIDSIQKLVQTNAKQRFALYQDPSTSKWFIRANQGHSIDVKVDMQLIKNSLEIPVVIHGTYQRHLKLILEQGLKSMSRKHIHFAVGLVDGAQQVISGMRKDCDMFIYIDAEKAIKGGIVFLRSANNVILTDGVNGVLHPTYFSKVVDRGGNSLLH